MSAMTQWTEDDTRKARAAWASYQQRHDVAGRIGQAVGVDPETGRVWFGANGLAAIDAARADGVTRPLFLLRVGCEYYQRKGGRR